MYILFVLGFLGYRSEFTDKGLCGKDDLFMYELIYELVDAEKKHEGYGLFNFETRAVEEKYDEDVISLIKGRDVRNAEYSDGLDDIDDFVNTMLEGGISAVSEGVHLRSGSALPKFIYDEDTDTYKEALSHTPMYIVGKTHYSSESRELKYVVLVSDCTFELFSEKELLSVALSGEGTIANARVRRLRSGKNKLIPIGSPFRRLDVYDGVSVLHDVEGTMVFSESIDDNTHRDSGIDSKDSGTVGVD